MDIRKIPDLFWQVSPGSFYLCVFLGLITGALFSVLIPMVILASHQDSRSVLSYIYPAACLSILLISSYSNILAVRLTNRGAIKLRMKMYEKIQRLPYHRLEQIGQAKLINLLNIDIPELAVAAFYIPQIWIGSATLMGTLGYIFFIDPKAFLTVILCLAVAMAIHQILSGIALRYFVRARDAYDRVQEGAKGLVLGAKELKLSTVKTRQYVREELLDPEDCGLTNKNKAQSVVIFAENYGQLVSFAVIGILLSGYHAASTIDQTELAALAMALLYLTGPVATLLRAAGGVRSGQVALERIKAFQADLKFEPDPQPAVLHPPARCIRLADIGFAYNNQRQSFCLKGINAEFNTGQISFITGGNGSGKSTLSKILSLHYIPTSGRIHFDTQELTQDKIACGREYVSAIYSDFYVFPKLYGDPEQRDIQRHLIELELDGILEVVDCRFSSTSLSDGQRKRLALLALLLENRPVCIFDEWAADQDPRFKDIFYRKVLPRLKAQGKIVIVISHDDRYFDCADQLIVMELGEIREVRKAPDLNAPHPAFDIPLDRI